ncbi:MAG: type II toxin-antitoxin system RelE/ParE family toxin [Nitrospirae bacterium]|nr:type II toxin-antitoxin system RelE/ParE family toxin [Nitrospirota bacterium]
MAYRVEFLPAAAREFEALDGSLKRIAAKQVEKLTKNPWAGDPLGNRMGIDLTGYRKIYFAKKAYRIVYEVLKDRVVVLIIGIGKRERAEIYRDVARRLGLRGGG